MKRIYLGLLIVTLAAGSAYAQDAATQQEIDKLNGTIQDLSETVAQDGKRIDALEKAIGDLRDKVNTPAPTGDYAANDDLKKLAQQVQEIDRKRQEDRDLILDQIKKIATASGSPVHIHTPPPDSDNGTSGNSGSGNNSGTTGNPPADVPTTGHYYTIKSGDRLSAIVKAYRDAGVKVTTSQVLKANPGLDPNKIIVGKKIFIPDANAK
jgi:LysM repeat protein